MKILVNAPYDFITDKSGKNDENVFFTSENIDKIESKFEVIWNKTKDHFTKEEVLERIGDVDAIITRWGSVKIDADIIENAPKLKLVAHLCGTVRPFVSEELYEKGIKVISANDKLFSESVAEAALVYAIMSLRRIDELLRNISNFRADGWGKPKKRRGLFDKSVGIIGFGSVAEHFVKLLQPFRCKIKVFTPIISKEKLNEYKMKRADLEEIFSTCDVISIHSAYNEQTHHMIDKKLLQKIKQDAVLVNTARGGIIDEAALTEELKKGNFFAVLDVFEKEPLPSESPLYDLENVIIMPHKGGPTPDRLKHIASAIIDEMQGFLIEGKPLKNEISKERAFTMSFS